MKKTLPSHQREWTSPPFDWDNPKKGYVYPRTSEEAFFPGYRVPQKERVITQTFLCYAIALVLTLGTLYLVFFVNPSI